MQMVSQSLSRRIFLRKTGERMDSILMRAGLYLKLHCIIQTWWVRDNPTTNLCIGLLLELTMKVLPWYLK